MHRKGDGGHPPTTAVHVARGTASKVPRLSALPLPYCASQALRRGAAVLDEARGEGVSLRRKVGC